MTMQNYYNEFSRESLESLCDDAIQRFFTTERKLQEKIAIIRYLEGKLEEKRK